MSTSNCYNFNNKCLEGCSTSFNTLRDLRLHLADEHEFKIETEHLKFSALVEFSAWYDDLCHNENVQYSKSKHISSGERSITYYNCNRSGNVKEIENAQHTKKKQESCKLNYSCTSQIMLVAQEKGYEATYYKTHYGHLIELQHIRLPKEEHFSVAAKLESGVTFSRILDDVRDNIDENLKRTELDTRKDLQNIKNAFSINNNESERQKDDTISIDMWIEKQRRSENNCVLFYKKQGEQFSESTISLKDGDLCLIIMNKSQEVMLKMFGQEIMTIENTHELNPNDFGLTTLMVIDEYGEAFPAACMFSNRNDTDIYKVFFSFIKDKCGILTPKVFMTDITDIYYNAWIQIMNIPSYRLYGSWHTDCTWRTHLNNIHMLEKREFVYKTIKHLETNVDEDAFARELEISVDVFLKDPDTSAFGHYFKENFLNNVKMWAHCYRKGCGINTNMYVESMLEKSVQCLHKGLQAVLTFIRDKTVERIIKLTKGKNICHKLQTVNCHRMAMRSKFKMETIDNNIFKVYTESERYYTIKKQKEADRCCEQICQLCQICIHAYSCECSDFLIDKTICKHVHMVAIKNNSIHNKESDRKQNQVIDNELSVHENNLGNSNKKSSNIEKNTTHNILSAIRTEVDSLSDNTDVTQINNRLNQIVSQLNIIKAKGSTGDRHLMQGNVHPTSSLSDNMYGTNTNKSLTQSQLNIIETKGNAKKELPIKVYSHAANKNTDKQGLFQSTGEKHLMQGNAHPTSSISDNMYGTNTNKSLNQSQLNIIKTKGNAKKERPIKIYSRATNKTIDRQRLFQCRKRKRKTKANVCLKKPNVEETNDIRAILFQ